MTRIHTAIIAGTIALTACARETPTAVSEPRPIKTFTVTELTGAAMRTFAGSIEAADTAALSFQIGGNVADVNVERGERVAFGDVIASLDAAPYELDLQGAEAELQRARADLEAKSGEVERQRSLYEKGWISAAAIDQHEAAYASALSSVEYARTRVGLARRNLENTEIRAPFDGVIATRNVEPFQDVAAGQPLFEINADGALQAHIAVPETNVAYIAVGQPAQVRVSPLDLQLEARVSEVGVTGAEGATYPVRVALFGATGDVRPGMTAEVSLQMRGGLGSQGGYLVPLSAIAPGDEPERGYVFIYDPDAGVVRQTLVAAAGVRDNLVVITDGIEPNDVIAAAGVSFLMDGQAVRLLDPTAGG